MRSNLRTILRRLAVAVLVLYWSAIFLGTHVPTSPSGSSHVNDKVLHIGAYCGLSFLLCWTALPARTWRGALGIMAVIATYGGVDEFSQLVVPTRSADVLDWAGDLLGGFLGFILYLTIATWVGESSPSGDTDTTLLRKDAA